MSGLRRPGPEDNPLVQLQDQDGRSVRSLLWAGAAAAWQSSVA